MKFNELESKIYNLEKRVNYLENEIKILQNKKNDSFEPQIESRNIQFEKSHNQIESENTNETIENLHSQTNRHSKALINILRNNDEKDIQDTESFEEEEIMNDFENKKSSKYSESIIGKYIVGGLASLLVFIGAVSFLSIIWNKIGPEAKLSIVGFSGTILTAIGLRMSVKKSSPISSILFGTGSGLIYISILSANLAFNLINNEISTVLCTIWTAFLMFSYKYTNLYFTIIIAYMGSYINLISELNNIDTEFDLAIIIIFVTSVCLIMLYNSYQAGSKKYTVSIFLCTLSYLTVIIFDYLYLFSVNIAILEIIPVLMIFILKNLLYRISNKEKWIGIHFIMSIISSLSILMLFMQLNLFNNYYSDFYNFLILFIINLIQFIINNIFYDDIEKGLSTYYSLLIYITVIGMNSDLFDIYCGAGITILILLIKEKIWGNENNLLFPVLMVLMDTFLIAWNFDDYYKIIHLIYLIANMALLLYLIFNAENTRKYLFAKNISLFIILFNCFAITETFLRIINLSETEMGAGIGHIIAILSLFAIYKSDLFKIEDDEEHETVKKSKVSISNYTGIYLASTILYLFGILFIKEIYELPVKFILSISTLAVCLMQTYMFFYKKENISNLSGAWFIIKYLIFTWTVISSFSSLPMTSVVYSVSGLILSVFAIYFGFRFNVKATRHFGLATTMLMVAKFIFVDLNGENSITRVLAFIAGGVLCFIISIIYNKLSKN